MLVLQWEDILSGTAAISKGSLSVINKWLGTADHKERLFPSELSPVSTPPLSAVVWGNRSWPLSPLLPAGHSLRNVTGNTHAIYRHYELLSQCLCLMWHAVQVRQDSFCIFPVALFVFFCLCCKLNILALPCFPHSGINIHWDIFLTVRATVVLRAKPPIQ